MNKKMIIPFPRTPYNSSSALIIVLCLLVLLTVLVLALLSRSVTSGLISQASANVSKSDLYGHGAIDQVLGDLRQEIAAGSTVAAVTPATGGPASIASPMAVTNASAAIVGYVYRPSYPTNAVPALQGPASYASTSISGFSTVGSTTLWNGEFPNLVKESTRSVPFYVGLDGNAPTRAAGVNSATDISRNGRSISTTRWNKALLLPKLSIRTTMATATTTGTTISADTSTSVQPVADFVAPDWILTAADGSNPTAVDTSSNLSTSNVNSKSPKYVVGRYAYTIYNEGGLIDANVAGAPGVITATTLTSANKFNASLSPPGTVPLTTFMSRKGSEAYADLTQLPGISSLGTVTQITRPQEVVDSLVGWRNNATVLPTTPDTGLSSRPLDYKFGSPAIISNYFNYLIGNSVRFMTTANTSSNPATGLSDEFFTSRQQMIAFFENLAVIGPNPPTPPATPGEEPYLQDAMMYLTPFTRTLNQPSYWPDPTRPTVVASGGIANAIGNTGYQLDNTFNPPFKSIRVISQFTRSDGTIAAVGDPLVKKRFALSRIAWLTCDGPIATDAGVLNTADPNIATLVNYYENTCGITAAFLSEGGPTNIYNYFGLRWNPTPPTGVNTLINQTPPTTSPGNYWIYDHKIAKIVGSLSDVAPLNRDPDFFELLKASVNCGAIAKSISTIGSNSYTQIQDTTVGVNILQLGANIIDEANPTQYPTHIIYTFQTNPTPPPTYDVRSVFGSMDLPYYSSMAPTAYIVQASTNIPLPQTTNNTSNEPQATTNALFASTSRGASGSPGLFSLSEGTGVLMNIPSVWNPYDINGPVNPTGIAPTSFRIAVVSSLPIADQSLATNSPTWPTLPGNTNGASYSFTLASVFNPAAGVLPANAPSTLVISTNNNYNPPVITTNSTSYPPSPWVAAGTYVASAWPTESSAALTFSNPTTANVNTLYREPTVLVRPNVPAGSSLTNDPGNVVYNSTTSGYGSGAYPAITTEVNGTNAFLGFMAQTFPLRWSQIATGLPTSPQTNFYFNANYLYISNPSWTVRVEYNAGSTAAPVWIPYMEYSAASQYTAFLPITEAGTTNAPYLLTPNTNSSSVGNMWSDNRVGCPWAQCQNPPTVQWDARSSRWGNPYDVGPRGPFIDSSGSGSSTAITNGAPLTDETVTLQPLGTSYSGSHSAGTSMVSVGAYEPSGGVIFGTKQQNLWSTPGNTPTTDFYADPDGTVRRASGAYVGGVGNPPSGGNINQTVAWTWNANTTVGLMLASATAISSTTTGLTQPAIPAQPYSQSRPVLLHRPYRSVAELGYVFSDIPYKNIDFFTPESGYGALLDTFCINEDYRPDAVAAGQFDLNTKQAPVIQAVLYGAYRDEDPITTTYGSTLQGPNLTAAESIVLSQALVTRTSNMTTAGKGPLINIADLVGRWTAGSTKGSMAAPIGWGSSPAPYDGFSADLAYATAGTWYVNSTGNTTPSGTTSGTGNSNILQRYRETTMRALSDSGQAGTWNLMIDLVAQSGRYPPTASGLPDFIVEGERRYWVHVAIDRSTGQIIDENIEPVNE